MKICFLVYQLMSGGAERTVSYLTAYMAEKGWDVTLLNTSGTESIFYHLDPRVKTVCLNLETEKGNVITNKINALRRNHAVHQYLENNTPDCLFCMMPFCAKYILDIPCRKKFKLITSERNNPAIFYEPGEIPIRDRIFSCSDGIVFQTERAKAYFPAEIQEKGRVIYNAVGNEYVKECSKAPVLREDKITAIGRLNEQKDYPTLFLAFQKVLSQFPKMRLEIFGDGELKQELLDLIAKLDLKNKVILKGTDKKAIVAASTSRVYVMSSLYEGMPNALMEAMAVGLPCVSTDCPNGPSELIRDGENGLLVPVGDVDALAAAILRMLNHPDFAESCGRNARKILDKQSVSEISQQYCNFIEEVCRKP